MTNKSDRYKKFLEWVSIKLQVNLNNKIGDGANGEVFDIGLNRVLKITQTNITEQQILINKNIDGICKVYSVGEIVVPKRFIIQQGRRYFIESDKSAFGGGSYSPNISLYYIIMEKLDANKAKSDLDFYIDGILDSFLDNHVEYVITTYNNHRASVLYILNKLRNNDDFLTELIEYANNSYFSKQSEINKFYLLLSELLKIFKNVSEYFNWVDIHTGQFGYDKKGNLKAFDIDSEDNKEYLDYIKPKHKIIENIMTFEQFNNQIPIILNINDIKIENNKELVLVDTSNVNDIIKASREGKIPLDKLRVETMANKIKSGNELPPIKITHDNILKDGYHRYAAHKLINKKDIKVLYI